MAVCVIIDSINLEEGLILTPERYNPSRRLNIKSETNVTPIKSLVEFSNETVTTKGLKKENKNVYLINTGDAYEGYLNGRKDFEDNINSSKKVVKNGDIIISRLRPYLKQIAYIDKDLNGIDDDNTIYVASTEFFVLRPRDGKSITFLVPFLLSEKIQSIFQNSVEGSQHPRFKEEDLSNLVIPNQLMNIRDIISQQVEESIKSVRLYEQGITNATHYCNQILNNNTED